MLTLTKLKLWQPRQLYQPFWFKHEVLELKNKVGLSFQSNTNSIMWFGKHTNRYKIQDLNGYQFYIMSKFSKFGTALLSSLPKHIFHCSHRKLKFFNILRNLDGYQFTCLPYYDIVYYQFSIYDKVLGDFKMPLFILFCLWIIDRTSHRLILFADLVSLFEPLREWLIFLKIGVGT